MSVEKTKQNIRPFQHLLIPYCGMCNLSQQQQKIFMNVRVNAFLSCYIMSCISPHLSQKKNNPKINKKNIKYGQEIKKQTVLSITQITLYTRSQAKNEIIIIKQSELKHRREEKKNMNIGAHHHTTGQFYS